MRKHLLFTLVYLLSLVLSAQKTNFKLGLKLAPILSNTRVQLDDELFEIENDGNAVKLSFGLIMDNQISDTYAFSTGLIYMPKEARVLIASGDSLNAEEQYKLQYLQIPLTLKLYTNELKPDLKVYFQLGGALEIKVYEEALATDESITAFHPIDVPVILGSGIEFRAGLTTTIFGGFSYQRGLLNIVKDTDIPLDEDFAVRKSVFSFDLGVKF